MKDIKEGVSLLQTASDGKATLGGVNNPNDAILARAEEASQKLREMIGDGNSGYFASNPNAERELKDFERSHGGQIQQTVVNSGMTKTDFENLKKETSNSNPLAGVAGFVGGDAARLRMVEQSQNAIRDLARIEIKVNDVKKAAQERSEIADAIRLKTAGLPSKGYIVTADPAMTKRDFIEAEKLLRSELDRPDVTGFRREDMKAAADKLADIVSDSSRFTSAKEQFGRLQADVEARAAAEKKASDRVNTVVRGQTCSGNEC
jgi:uncharacterized protein (UPF0297 family)